jgi:alkanesulfonate monooxygenase SsuD/methylene tetrahydromethanopterin reductase-like flavin-dependent oxidoreductase (luciferase family)
MPSFARSPEHGAPAVGVALNEDLLIGDPSARKALLARIEAAGLDHVTTGDHISFQGGQGFDGMVSAAAVLSASDSLNVLIGVFLAGLRHPMVTARQLATVSQIAPGRLVLGAGVGGEDRSEISNAGVDPKTRGRRLDETLDLLRRLAGGEPVDHEGEFFSLEQARILPAPDPRVPLVIGGAGDTAVRRTAEHGDGWLGIFCSARRYADTVEQIRAATAELGRPDPSWFGLSMWVGLGTDGDRARTLLGDRMHALYNLPPEKFQNVTAAGTPDQVAERLAPFVEGGARHLTLVTVAESADEGIELAGEVRRLIQAAHVPVG